MNFKKTVAIATAAGALAAISVPAMALENEFHGMYRMYGYMTNALSGGTSFNLAKDSVTDKFFEQRARIQYIAKASDSLKLVTHFELDTKFGGTSNTKYPIGDAGGLDADRISLETKNVYLDFSCPVTGANVKAGIQPFSDALQGTFGNFDATGIVISKKFDSLTGTYGYFTTGTNNSSFDYKSTPNGISISGAEFPSSRASNDLNVLDVKYALNKDVTLGSSFYNQIYKVSGSGATLTNNTFGINAAAKVGPAALTATFGYQFGKQFATNNGTSAFSGAVAAKIAAGPGKVNVAALYLSGDKDKVGYNHGWQSVAGSAAVNFFTPANMWLLTRNVATINSSTAVGGNADLNWGSRGLMGVFAGYDGAMGKAFYSGNVGYGRVAEKQGAFSPSIGTELNATVGYKMYDNLSASVTGAYLILGDGLGEANVTGLRGATTTKADNPFLTNIALNYAF